MLPASGGHAATASAVPSRPPLAAVACSRIPRAGPAPTSAPAAQPGQVHLQRAHAAPPRRCSCSTSSCSSTSRPRSSRALANDRASRADSRRERAAAAQGAGGPLTDRANHLNANLASTSESVVRGNKALTTERAQFHAKFAGRDQEAGGHAGRAGRGRGAAARRRRRTPSCSTPRSSSCRRRTPSSRRRARRSRRRSRPGRGGGRAARRRRRPPSATQAALQAQCDDLTRQVRSARAQHSLVLSRQEELAEELDSTRPLLTEAEPRADGADGELEATRSKRPRPTTGGRAGRQAGGCALAATGAARRWTRAHGRAPGGRRRRRRPRRPSHGWGTATGRCRRAAAPRRCGARRSSGAPWRRTARCTARRRPTASVWRRSTASPTPWPSGRDGASERRGAERVVVAHVFTDSSCVEDALVDMPCCLSASIRDNPLAVARPFDESLHLAARGSRSGGGRRLRPDNAFVQAVSADLKFHMDDSQALYKSSRPPEPRSRFRGSCAGARVWVCACGRGEIVF